MPRSLQKRTPRKPQREPQGEPQGEPPKAKPVRVVWIYGPDLSAATNTAQLLFLKHEIYSGTRIADYIGQECLLFAGIDTTSIGRIRLAVQRLLRWEALSRTQHATFVVTAHHRPEHILTAAGLVACPLPPILAVNTLDLATTKHCAEEATKETARTVCRKLPGQHNVEARLIELEHRLH